MVEVKAREGRRREGRLRTEGPRPLCRASFSFYFAAPLCQCTQDGR